MKRLSQSETVICINAHTIIDSDIIESANRLPNRGTRNNGIGRIHTLGRKGVGPVTRKVGSGWVGLR